MGRYIDADGIRITADKTFRDADGDLLVRLEDVKSAIAQAETVRLTNAEKLAKNKKFMRNACLNYDCSDHDCDVCPLYGFNESRNYHECKADDDRIDKWLEQEVTNE